jgi:ABC-type multidrug transport system ATPase subunit
MNELNTPEWIGTLCSVCGIPESGFSEIFSALGLGQRMTGHICSMSDGNKRKIFLASALLGIRRLLSWMRRRVVLISRVEHAFGYLSRAGKTR